MFSESTKMRSMLAGLILLAVAASTAGAQSVDFARASSRPVERKPEAIGLDGRSFYAPVRSAEDQAKIDPNVQAAAYDFTLHDPNTILWMGRWYGFGWRFNDAIAVFTRGAAMFPDDPRFLRHRGHRYLSTRQFDKAAADFEKAALLVAGKPDQDEFSGMRDEKPSRLGGFKYNLFYHTGVTYFVKGDFARALVAFNETTKYINGDEARVAVADWKYMTLRRLGRRDEAKALVAAIPEGLPITENAAYYRRILMYKGVLKPEQLLSIDRKDQTPDEKALDIATQGYGVGDYYLVEGDTAKARQVFQLVTAGPQWAAFGFIAAEADLARMKGGR